MICSVCGSPHLYYRDDTNGRYRCKEHIMDTPDKPKTDGAQLYQSYEAAMASARQADDSSKQVQEWLESQPIETPEQAEWAAKAGAFVAGQIKKLDDFRVSAKAPWLAGCRAIDNQFQPVIKRLKAVKAKLAGRIKALEQAKAEAQAKALTAASCQTPEQVQKAVAVLAPPPSNTQLRKSWTWEPEDGGPIPLTLADAQARKLDIPPEYWVLDTQRIAKMARDQKQAFAVPGLRSKLEQTVAFKQ